MTLTLAPNSLNAKSNPFFQAKYPDLLGNWFLNSILLTLLVQAQIKQYRKSSENVIDATSGPSASQYSLNLAALSLREYAKEFIIFKKGLERLVQIRLTPQGISASAQEIPWLIDETLDPLMLRSLVKFCEEGANKGLSSLYVVVLINRDLVRRQKRVPEEENIPLKQLGKNPNQLSTSIRKGARWSRSMN